ncbi:MAG: hypothetical protein BRC53_02210 [Cyanobacteria bacterium SW_6_48_11]|nr:MAG: hypothetical protein BRC53_02210 [Cyanobacteria bacterium SW_6_48_11]
MAGFGARGCLRTDITESNTLRFVELLGETSKGSEEQGRKKQRSRGAEKKEDVGTRGHADAGKIPVHSKSPHGDLTGSSAFLEPRVLVSASPHLRVRSEATAPLHLRTPYYLHHLMIMPRLISLVL